MKMNEEIGKKAKAVGIAAVLIGAGLMGGFVLDNPATIVQEKIVNIEVEKIVNTETIKTVEVIKEIDNGKLSLVTGYLEDNFGDELVFEDASEIVENIEMEDSYQDKSVASYKEDYKDHVSAPNGYVLSDASLVKIREASVKAISYEDKEFVVSLEAEVLFENDDSKETVFYNVTYDYMLDIDDLEDVEITSIEA